MSTYLTAAEVADMLGITPKTLRRLVAEGVLPAYRLGPRMLRFKAEEVEAAIKPVPTVGTTR